jgi:F-type H+-transporting ATPase subunit c
MVRKLWMRLGGLVVVAAASIAASPIAALAQAGGSPEAPASRGAGLIGLGIGLGLGAAALGCGLGQGKLAASAMESIGRNPNSTNQLFVPMIIGLAFIESLTLYSLVVSFFLLGKM